MNILNRPAEYLAVLQIASHISWIYCHRAEEDTNTDMFGEARMDSNLNENSSSSNAIQNFEPEVNRLTVLTDEERSRNGENKIEFDNNHGDFKNMWKRNAHADYRMGKRKQSIKHKKPNEVNSRRSRPFQRKSKEKQHKLKLDKIKKYENQETSLYETNKNPLEGDKSGYNEKSGVDISYKNSKNSQVSNENDSNKLFVHDRKKERTKIESSLPNFEESSHKAKDGYFKGTNIITEQIDKESSKSENSDERIKKRHGHKIKRKNLTKPYDIQGNVEDPHIKPHISRNENHVQETVLRTENVKDSESDEFDGGKSYDLVRKEKRSKFNDYTREKSDVLKSKEYLNKETSEEDCHESHSPNGNNVLQSHEENINTSLFEHTNHKNIHNHARNYYGQNYAPNHNSLQISNSVDLNHIKKNKRSKEKSSFETHYILPSDSKRGNYDDSNRRTKVGSNLDIEDNVNNSEYETDFSQGKTNKRDQRDLKKRLSKHNKYKNHVLEDNTVFGYQKNSDDSEDLNVGEDQTGEDSYNSESYKKTEQHQPFDVSSKNDGKYSYKESFEDESRAVNSDESFNKKYSRKKTFSRQSHEPRQNKEKCIEYKEEKVTQKSTCTTVSTTEKCTTKGTTCSSKRTTVKTKPTTQPCDKSLTTKHIESEKVTNNNTSSETLDVFEKYLCGQLTDDFVDAVMEKVKRSRKIYKELGFRNDSEETCDRCIETKPNKMPNKETMKTSMGKCLKSNEYKPRCSMCYSVPKPMEQVLNRLVLFEKEHENSVYNKILDDSSFIFTGDYPEQFNKNDNSGSNNKYASDRDYLSKDAFDKQDLREDSNEEKHNDQVANGNVLNDELNDATTLESENKDKGYSTETGVNKDEDTDQEYDTKSNVGNGIKHEDIVNDDENKARSSMDLVDNVEENDFNDESEMNEVPIGKYSSLHGPDTDKPNDSFDICSTKQRRKAFKSDKFLDHKNTYVNREDPDTEGRGKMKTHHLGERTLGFIENSPSRNRYGSEELHKVPKEHDISIYDNIREHPNTPYLNKVRWSSSKNNKLSPYNYLSNEKFSHNPFGFSSDDYKDEGEQLLHSRSNGHSVADGFMSTGWDSDEYELMPKQSNRQAHKHNIVNSVPRSRYHNGYEERLNMVKRESEPSYEDQPLFIEVPNIEYDLY